MTYERLAQYIPDESRVMCAKLDGGYIWMRLLLPSLMGVSCEVDLGEQLVIDNWGKAIVISYCLQLGLNENEGAQICEKLSEVLPTKHITDEAA